MYNKKLQKYVCLPFWEYTYLESQSEITDVVYESVLIFFLGWIIHPIRGIKKY